MNETIKAFTRTIKRYEKEIQNSYMYIGMNLYELSRHEEFKKSEYKNISEYSEKVFGYEKTKTYELISIYEKFFKNELDSHKNNLTYADYSISQLRYMLNMSEEQIKKCSSEMTVKEIIQLKSTFSARAECESVENTELLKNKNVIEGVFPEKNEYKEEDKTNTIIISELPQEIKKENKTITIELKTEQNEDYATNEEEAQEDYYKMKYQESLVEIENLKALLKKKEDKLNFYLNNLEKQTETVKYFYKELWTINNEDCNYDKIEKLLSEINDYILRKKLPEKVYFMQKVI